MADGGRAAAAATRWAAGEPLVLGGDFNLREPAFEGIRALRGRDVDHLFVAGLDPRGEAEVLDRGALSDHPPLAAPIAIARCRDRPHRCLTASVLDPGSRAAAGAPSAHWQAVAGASKWPDRQPARADARDSGLDRRLLDATCTAPGDGRALPGEATVSNVDVDAPKVSFTRHRGGPHQSTSTS